MIRLHFVVEGQTEETFVRDLLAFDLGSYGIASDVRCFTTGRRRGRTYRGGVVSFAQIRHDLELWLKEDKRSDARFTSMIDLYRLPTGFPGYSESCSIRDDPIRKAEYLEEAFASDVKDRRFLPYLQVHEFEALLFSGPQAFLEAFPGRQAEIGKLEAIRAGFPSPEHIDEGTSTSPSKRIAALLPDYEKPTAGPLIASRIGLETMTRQCAHFARWLERLRQTASA